MKTIKSIAALIVHIFMTLDSQISTGIDDRNWKKVVFNALLTVLVLMAIALTGILIVLFLLRFKLAVAVGVLLFCGIEALPAKGNTNFVDKQTADEVETALTEERALEQQDEVGNLTFSAVQGASATTPLIRPHDKYDIQPSKADGKYFYLYKGKIPVYQWEADLEVEIGQVQEDVIQRELQRNIIKNLPRFPMLLSEEARGRAAVEVLDVKNLGGHVVIEVVLVNSASIPLVDARRRARIERQKRQEHPRPYIDDDYSE